MTTWFSVELMEISESGPVAATTITIPGGSSYLLGRLLCEADTSNNYPAWNIVDKTLSRSQLRLTLPKHDSGARVAKVIGKKPSFMQTAEGGVVQLIKDISMPVPEDAVLWLSGNASTKSYKHPVKIVVTSSSPPDAGSMPSPSPTPVPVAAAAAAAAGDSSSAVAPAPAAPAAAAPAASGEWQVRLGGQFLPYEDASVQSALEEALHVRGKKSKRVTVRGAQYDIKSVGGEEYQQVLVSDKSRVRDVRRKEQPPPACARIPMVTAAARKAAAPTADSDADELPGAAAGKRKATAPVPQVSVPPPKRAKDEEGASASAAINLGDSSEGEGMEAEGMEARGCSSLARGKTALEKAEAAPGEEMEMEAEAEAEDGTPAPGMPPGGYGSLVDRVAALRRRGEALCPTIFDGESDVEGELAFLLEQSPSECYAALVEMRGHMKPHDASSHQQRVRYIATIVAEQAAAGALPDGAMAAGALPDGAMAASSAQASTVQAMEVDALSASARAGPPATTSHQSASKTKAAEPAASKPAASKPAASKPAASKPAPSNATQAATAASSMCAASGGAASSGCDAERVEMLLMDMAETKDGAIDLYGVDSGGASSLIRVTGFRNHCYVQLGGPPTAAPPPPPLSTTTEAAAEAAAAAGGNQGGWSAAPGGGLLGVAASDELLSLVCNALAPPCRVLLHTCCAVCRAWRRSAGRVLCESVTSGLLEHLPSGSSASQLSIELVHRTPLLAYYGETLAQARQQGARPAAAAAAAGGAAQAGDAGATHALAGTNRSVPMLKVEYAARLKPRELLAAFKKAAASAPLRGLFALAADGEVVSAETGLAPAGTTALLRRFAVEKSLAGGGWLVADAMPTSHDSRCSSAYTCAHTAIDGKAVRSAMAVQPAPLLLSLGLPSLAKRLQPPLPKDSRAQTMQASLVSWYGDCSLLTRARCPSLARSPTSSRPSRTRTSGQNFRLFRRSLCASVRR